MWLFVRSEILSVTVPEGWTNTLSDEEKAARKKDLCIDDASTTLAAVISWCHQFVFQLQNK
jgi:hypothetical protein